MKGRNTYVLSTRVPDKLYAHIKVLADQRGMTVSDWLKGIIVAATGYRLDDDLGASQGISGTGVVIEGKVGEYGENGAILSILPAHYIFRPTMLA